MRSELPRGRAAPDPPAAHRPVPDPRLLARLALAHVALLFYGTMYPWRGWRWTDAPPWAFLFRPEVHRHSSADLWVNLVMFMPLGLLVALALSVRRRPGFALLSGILLCTALSLLVESLQTYLPTRVSSRTDWQMNTLGGALGAAIGIGLHRIDAATRTGLWHRPAWIAPGRHAMLSVTVAWLLAQAAPQRFLTETGVLLAPVMRVITGVGPAGWRPDLPDPSGGWLAPGLVALAVACNVAALVTIVRGILAPRVPGWAIALAVPLSAWLIHLAGDVSLLRGTGADFAQAPSIRLGMAVGSLGGAAMGLALAAWLTNGAGRRTRAIGWWLVAGAIVLAAILVNLALAGWYAQPPGELSGLKGVRVNLLGLLRAVAMFWPLFALGVIANVARGEARAAQTR